MLLRGEKLKPRYANFDFSALDEDQHTLLKKLTMFSKNKERIIKKFSGDSLSHDVKIIFLDQHSMKLGNGVFYGLEGARQTYI